MTKRYRAAIEVKQHPNGLSEKEALRLQKTTGSGACDALWLASLSFRPDGTLSVCFDGVNLPDSQWLRVWAFLAGRLLLSEDVGPQWRQLCAFVWQTWCELFEAESTTTPREVALTYHVTYKSEKHPEGLTLSEAKRRPIYASDAFVLAFMIDHHPGVLFGEVSIDPLDDTLWWQVWALLAERLLDCTGLSAQERAMPELVHQVVKEAMSRSN